MMPIISMISQVVLLLAQLLDELSFAQLAVLAFVLRFAALHVAAPDSSKAPQAVGAVSMLAYLAHWAAQGNSDVVWLIVYLMRSGLVYVVAAGIATPLLLSAAGITRFLEGILARTERWYVEWQREMQDRLLEAERAAAPPPPAPPPPVPRGERMRQEATAAREEFDAEAEVIQSLPLDEDEREVMILRARQRMLQKLAQLTER